MEPGSGLRLISPDLVLGMVQGEGGAEEGKGKDSKRKATGTLTQCLVSKCRGRKDKVFRWHNAKIM